MGFKSRNLFKLVTREDPNFIHKALGFSCLINFIYQFTHLFRYGKMNLRNNQYAPLLIILHGLLSVSSFIFHVPLNRHKGLPMIYKEFRLHSIIFALRSVFCALCFYYKLNLVFNVFFINLTMICADIVTKLYEAETKTMRGMPYSRDFKEEDKKKVTYMHSVQQFGATMFMIGNIDSAFAPLLAIQIAAFLMTLVRKSIISELDWHRLYSISLWLNIFVYWSFNRIDKPIYIIMGVYLFDYLRVNQGHNKYLVWNYIFLIIYVMYSFVNFAVIEAHINQPLLTNLLITYYLASNIYRTRKLWW